MYMKYIVSTITSENKTDDFSFISTREHKLEKAIFALPGFEWSRKEGFHPSETNKDYLLIKTLSEAEQDSMFCSLDMSGAEHENMKKLYFLIMQG